MKNDTINFVILTAGNGTRMKSDLPKIFHKVANFTMLEIVADIVSKVSLQFKDYQINKVLIT